MNQIGGAFTALTMPLVAITNAIDKKNQTGGSTNDSSAPDKIISILMSLAIAALAGYLCWKCNANSDAPLRILFTFFAVMFGWIYLVYYFIYRVMMKKTCE